MWRWPRRPSRNRSQEERPWPAVSPQPPAPLKSAVSESSPISSSWCGHGTATRRPWTLIRRYTGFVRLKASSYFLAGGESEDLNQEGLIGLYKAVRDFRADKETSFRSFAELCITRQIITAIKTATRFKHAPLNTYVSFSQTPAGQDDGECTLGDALPGPGVDDPAVCVISTEELQSLVSLPWHGLVARVGCASPLPGGQLVRGDGRRARLRHEDDRQRAPAREAQGLAAPVVAVLDD